MNTLPTIVVMTVTIYVKYLKIHKITFVHEINVRLVMDISFVCI